MKIAQILESYANAAGDSLQCEIEQTAVLIASIAARSEAMNSGLDEFQSQLGKAIRQAVDTFRTSLSRDAVEMVRELQDRLDALKRTRAAILDGDCAQALAAPDDEALAAPDDEAVARATDGEAKVRRIA